MRILAGVLASLLFAANCSAAPPAPSPRPAGQPAPEREKFVALQLKVLKLAVENARLKHDPDLELRVLIDEGVAAPYDEVRSAAFRMLGDLPQARRLAAVPEVLQRFRSGSAAFRVLALEFLGRAPGPDAERTVLEATRDPNAEVRLAAASVLRSSAKPAAVKATLGLLEDPDPGVKLAALDALATPGRTAVVADLIHFMGRQTDARILERTAHALGVIGSPMSVKALADLLERSEEDDVRWSCINSLGKIGDPAAAVRLAPCLAPDQPVNIRQVTIEALGKLKAVDFLPQLARILAASREEELRRAAAGAIGRMGSVGAIETILLPTYLAEKSEPVRREAWTAMLGLAGEGFDPNERFARALLNAGRRQEAQEICTRMHAMKPGEEHRERHLRLEQAVADAAYGAGDHQAALAHLRILATQEPGNRQTRLRMAACYRTLKDYEAALSALSELAANEKPDTPEWWETQLEILEVRGLMKDPVPQIELAHALLQVTPLEAAREQRIRESLRAGAVRLAIALETAAPEARTAVLEKAGPKIIDVLASALEAGEASAGPLLKVGNAVTGTAFEPDTTNPEILKEAAAKWRAWLKARPK